MKFIRYILIGVFFLFAPWVLAQDSDRSSSDPGVLVAGPNHVQVSDQDSTGNTENSDASSQNTTGSDNNSAGTSNPDGIVDRATQVVISGMTASLNLTQDQISAIQPIVADNLAKTKNLQQNLLDGVIDAATMNAQRQQLSGQENMALSSILTPAQMKIWINMQTQSQESDQNQNSSNSSGKHSSSK